MTPVSLFLSVSVRPDPKTSGIKGNLSTALSGTLDQALPELFAAFGFYSALQIELVVNQSTGDTIRKTM